MNASICTGHRAAWAAAHGVAPLTRQMMCRGRPTTMFFGSTGWVGRLCAFRAEAGGLGSRPGRLLSGAPGEGGGGGGAKSGMVDVQGGKVEDTSRAEGHLVWAERVKNIVAAHRRFQLTTYNRLPEDHNDQSSIHTDSQRTAVTGLLHKEKQNLVILLRNNQPSHQQHKDNASRMASASVAVGHLDPVQLVPVFTRVGLMPPVVRLVGDLVPIQPQYDEELRAAMGVGQVTYELSLDDIISDTIIGGSSEISHDALFYNLFLVYQDAGSLYWLEPAGIFFEDIFSERTQVETAASCMCMAVCVCCACVRARCMCFRVPMRHGNTADLTMLVSCSRCMPRPMTRTSPSRLLFFFFFFLPPILPPFF